MNYIRKKWLIRCHRNWKLLLLLKKKKLATYWEKMFTILLSDQGLFSKLCITLSKLNNKKTAQYQKGVKNSNRYVRYEQGQISVISWLFWKLAFIQMYILCHSHISKPHPLQSLVKSLEEHFVSSVVSKRNHFWLIQLVINHNS